MKRKSLVHPPLRLRNILGAGLVLALMTAPLLTGCDSDQEGASLLDPTSSTGTLAMTPPTLDEIQAAAGLTRDEAARLEPALNQWREQAATQKGQGFRRGDGKGPGKRPDPPHFAFLAGCSANLTAQQFAKVVDLIVQKREQFREERRAEHQARFQNEECTGPGEGQGFGMHRGDGDRRSPGMHRGERGDRRGPGGFFADLNLTEDQREPFHRAMKTAHTALRDAHNAFMAGDITAEQVRDRARAAVDALENSLQTILSAEQFELLTQKMDEHRVQMAERRLEHLGQGLDRRVEHLTELLNLDEGQVAAITGVLRGSLTEAEALMNQVKDGSIGFADALYQGILLHEQTRDQIREQLNADQQIKFDALQKLHRGGPRWMRLYL